MNTKATLLSVASTNQKTSQRRIDQSIVIGKDVLELLTGAMYVDPLTVFREYIQNAADSIDQAKAQRLYSTETPRVHIHLDSASRSIKIRDNGTGISAQQFISRLTAIGASQKRGKRLRGFRGVGRLSGLAYAQELVFRSRSSNSEKISELSWNGRRLREVLRDGAFSDDLQETIREVALFTTREALDEPAHFFEVELRGVIRTRNDVLLNPEEIRRYLSQVAPVPFSPSFTYGKQITAHLKEHGVDTDLHVYIASSDQPIYRPFTDAFSIGQNLSDKFAEIETITVPGIHDGVDAFGWILHHSYYGSLPKRLGVAGLRARSGNIQIGDQAIFEELFTEQRFNSWCVGEIHILSDRIVPNARRDNFEVNVHFDNLHGHVAGTAARISKHCRDKSILRNRLRKAHLIYQDAYDRLDIATSKSVPPLVRKYYRDSVVSSIDKLTKFIDVDTKLTDEEQSLVKQRIQELRKGLARHKTNASALRLAFLPERKRKPFLEMLNLVLDSCESPAQATDIASRIIAKAKRSGAR